jgi:hypothetical protein
LYLKDRDFGSPRTTFRPAAHSIIAAKWRVGDVKGRIRRIAIIAMTRKLMVSLWRYLETGVVPTGAVLRASF